jgi:hypothetical protein
MSQPVAVNTEDRMSSQAIEGDFAREVPRFQLFLNCYNCQRPSCRYMQAVPPEITTEDELIESGLLAKQSFLCQKCECPIGTITGIKIEWIEVPF